ncbi:MAG: hypothetical protein PVJ61_02260 [Dehalococcoidia bacterium]|jgi:hypothetical protein
MKCAYHPDVETELRCGKCGKPICLKCMVQTPVGARCPDCARVKKLPTYRLAARHYLIAAATALGMAIATGLVWGVLRALLPYIIFNIFLGGAVGFAIGEVVGRAINRKRGKWLALIGGLAVPASYLASIPFNMMFHYDATFHLLDLAAIAVGIFVAVIRLR